MMTTKKASKLLLSWTKKVCNEYPGLEIKDLDRSWKDGRGFCALIHRFRPDLLDFGVLNPDEVYQNNDLAFAVAEKKLGIPAFLDPEDMATFPYPDRLSVMTYLMQFYKFFGPLKIGPVPPLNRTRSKNMGTKVKTLGRKRDETLIVEKDPPKDSTIVEKICAKCNQKIYLLEMDVEDGLSVHRTCKSDPRECEEVTDLPMITTRVRKDGTIQLVTPKTISPIKLPPKMSQEAKIGKAKFDQLRALFENNISSPKSPTKAQEAPQPSENAKKEPELMEERDSFLDKVAEIDGKLEKTANMRIKLERDARRTEDMLREVKEGSREERKLQKEWMEILDRRLTFIYDESRLTMERELVLLKEMRSRLQVLEGEETVRVQSEEMGRRIEFLEKALEDSRQMGRVASN